jgi:hypothetical protein
MYPGTIRTKQLVRTPSGRLWEVVTMVGTAVLLRDPESLEEMEIHPRYISHVFTPANSSQPLEMLEGSPVRAEAE